MFSSGQQRVRIEKATADKPNGMGDTCLLDPNSPLIVIDTTNTDAGHSLIAEVQGNPANEWPFCPVHAEVSLKSHQIFQKPALFESIREVLAGLLNR